MSFIVMYILTVTHASVWVSSSQSIWVWVLTLLPILTSCSTRWHTQVSATCTIGNLAWVLPLSPGLSRSGPYEDLGNEPAGALSLSLYFSDKYHFFVFNFARLIRPQLIRFPFVLIEQSWIYLCLLAIETVFFWITCSCQLMWILMCFHHQFFKNLCILRTLTFIVQTFL